MQHGGIVPSVEIIHKEGTDFVSAYDLSAEGHKALTRLLQYENNFVIERYMLDHEVSRPRAEALFKGLLQYLAVCAFVDGAHTPASDIDEIWHTFILHMKNYEGFCLERAGGMIYHDPALDNLGITYYRHTRKCAEALCGQLDPSVWPVEHVQYALCISTKCTDQAPFNMLRKHLQQA